MRGAVVHGPGGTDGARMGTPAARGGCGLAARGVVGCAGRGLAARGGAVCCGGAGWWRAEVRCAAGARASGVRRCGVLRGAGWRRAEDARLPRAALDIRRRAARRAAFLIYKLPPKAASL